jgi:hypothetical protein
VRDWLKEVDRYASPETCKLLIGNKSDRTDKVVTESEGAALAADMKMPFLETSARTSDNVEKAFVKVRAALRAAAAGYLPPSTAPCPCCCPCPFQMADDLIKMRAAAKEAEPAAAGGVALDDKAGKKGGCC